MELTQQTCKVCGRVDKFNFHVPDDVWEMIVPCEFQNRVVCLSCFDDFAKERGVNYADYINELYFAGKRGTFIFATLSRC